MSSTSVIPEDWSTLSTINTEFKTLLATLPGGQDFRLVTPGTTIESLRRMSEGVLPSEKWPGIGERDVFVAMEDGYDNRVRVYSLDRVEEEGIEEEKGPLLVLFHGGGFCVGKLEHEEDNCRKWVRDHRGVAVSVGMRLAPEHKFPVPIEDAWASFKWVASHASEIGADPSKGFLIGGVSSGATCSIVSSHRYRDEGLSPPLTGIFLSLPIPCMPAAFPEPHASDTRVVSPTQNAHAPIFGIEALDLFSAAYDAPAHSPLRSSFLWPTGHANLPPTYFQIAGLDIARDYALIFEEVLRREGGRTRVELWPGLPHGFWSFFPEAGFSRDVEGRTREGLRWLLENGESELLTRGVSNA